MSSRTPATAKAADRRSDTAYVDKVSARVNEELTRRVGELRRNGRKPGDLGDPDELAARMLAAVPQPSPWQELGPFYTTSGLARLLNVSRQAIEERRRRTILALRTADRVWVYPAFQLDRHNRVMRGLADLLGRFRPRTTDDEWMVAAFLTAPQPALGGRSVVNHLRSGGALDQALALAGDRAGQWAMAS